MSSQEATADVALLAVAAGVLCGLPVIGSIGVAGALAGLGIGSGILVVVGLSVAGIGARR